MNIVIPFAAVSLAVVPSVGFNNNFTEIASKFNTYAVQTDVAKVITVAHTFAADVLFTDALYDIGKSGATRPRDLFLSRNLTVGGTTLFLNSGAESRVTINDGTAGSYSDLVFRAGTNYAWLLGANVNYAGFEITPATAAGGTTFTTPAVKIAGATGIVTLSSQLIIAAGGFNVTGAGVMNTPTSSSLSLNTTTGAASDNATLFYQRGGATKWRIGTNISGANNDTLEIYTDSGGGAALSFLIATRAMVANGDLLFTDALYDIGKTGATRPRDGFFSRYLATGGAIVGASATSGSIILPGGVSLRSTNTALGDSFALISGTGGGVDRVNLSPDGKDIRWGRALIALGAGAAATLGLIGGTGPSTAAQNSWMQVLDSAGAAFWVPAWK